MTGVAPWLTATVCFVDLDQLPRDQRLEVRTAGRLVAPKCYEVVASYAFSYSQAARVRTGRLASCIRPPFFLTHCSPELGARTH